MSITHFIDETPYELIIFQINNCNSVFLYLNISNFYSYEYAQLLLSADNFNTNGPCMLTIDLLLSTKTLHLMHYAQIIRM